MHTREEGSQQSAVGSRQEKADTRREIKLRIPHPASRIPHPTFTFYADLLLLVIGLLACWLTLLPVRTQEVDVGTDSTELAYVYGTYQRERVDNRSFRWLSGDAG